MSQVILFLVFFFMMFINYFYGKNIGIISKSYKIKQTPPPITFSIWGLIYMGLFISILYNNWSKSMSILFIISCVFNCLWLFFFSKKNESLQLLSMIGLITTLCLIYYMIIKFDSIIDLVSFGIYLGWVSIALLISVFIYLKKYNLSETTLDIISVIYFITVSISLYTRYQSIYLLIPYLWTALIKIL
jgi:benzodiazapine receptor